MPAAKTDQHSLNLPNARLQACVKEIPLNTFCPKWQGWNTCCIVLSPIRTAPVVQVKSSESASHGSGAGRALGPISFRRRVTPQRRRRVKPVCSTSSSVRKVAGKGGGKTRTRSAAAVEKRILKGIAKRWEKELQAPNTREEETPSFGNLPGPANLSQYYQAQSEAASSSSGHNQYGNFLADQVRLKRPLPSSTTQPEGVYRRVWERVRRDLPAVAAEVEKTPGKSVRRSYLCEEARRAVTATLGVNRVHGEHEEVERGESSCEETSEGLEPNTVTRRKQQPGTVTVCAQSVSGSHPPTTRYSSSRPPTSRCTSSVRSTVPPTVGCNNSAARTPSWYQHDTSRK